MGRLFEVMFVGVWDDGDGDNDDGGTKNDGIKGLMNINLALVL